jgi:hypothetical protein
MFHSALRIALSKASTAEERAALEQALAAAEELEHVESDFEGKINASKAARGEKPTSLSKARRAQVRGYADDAAAMSKEQLSVLQAELGASEIVNALHVGLQSDLQFWNNEVAKQYGIKAIPQNLLLDPEGKIIAKNLRGEELDAKLGEAIEGKKGF